jgi:hypothetical protein
MADTMADEEKHSTPLAILRKQVSGRLRELDEEVSFWRPRAFVGHIAVAVLGAMITLIAGLNVSGWTPPSSAVLRVILQRQNLILILGVMITVVSAWQAFYNHRERWVGYASSAERLRTLLAKVEFKSRPGAPQDSQSSRGGGNGQKGAQQGR